MWLPSTDTHMAEWLKASERVDGRGVYQYPKLEAACSRVRRFGMAVDVGAHVGTWSRILAARFARVYAFEPVPLHGLCWTRNMAGVRNAVLVPVALGAKAGTVAMVQTPENTGESWVCAGPGTVPLVRLDDIIHRREIVDLIKLDCEGYEALVVQGAMSTLCRDLPVVIVEQVPQYAERHGIAEMRAVHLLEGVGYVVVQQLTNDYILVHPESVHGGNGHG